MQISTTDHAYVLGHERAELERLERQGRFLHELTRGVFLRAGLRPGMRVLDVGAGAGDVSLIAAGLVGPSGQVVALDRASEALGRARGRLSALRVGNVELRQGDAADPAVLAELGSFDAVIGRLVLLHQRDPAALLASLGGLLRPGGIMAFHEIEIAAGCWSNPRLPLLDSAFGWITRTFLAGGMASDIGARMADGFERAGLEDVNVMLEGRVEAGAQSGAYEFMARTVRSLLPLTLRLGLASEAEIDVDTLEARLRDEAIHHNAHFIPAFFSAAWARRPA